MLAVDVIDFTRTLNFGEAQDKVRLRSCTGGPEPDNSQHMPFTREAIARSVTKLIKEGDVPEFRHYGA